MYHLLPHVGLYGVTTCAALSAPDELAWLVTPLLCACGQAVFCCRRGKGVHALLNVTCAVMLLFRLNTHIAVLPAAVLIGTLGTSIERWGGGEKFVPAVSAVLAAAGIFTARDAYISHAPGELFAYVALCIFSVVGNTRAELFTGAVWHVVIVLSGTRLSMFLAWATVVSGCMEYKAVCSQLQGLFLAREKGVGPILELLVLCEIIASAGGALFVTSTGGAFFSVLGCSALIFLSSGLSLFHADIFKTLRQPRL